MMEQPSYHTTCTCCHMLWPCTSFHCSIINTCEGDSDLCTFTNIHHYTHDLTRQFISKGLQAWNNYSTGYLNIDLHVSTCPQECTTKTWPRLQCLSLPFSPRSLQQTVTSAAAHINHSRVLNDEILHTCTKIVIMHYDYFCAWDCVVRIVPIILTLSLATLLSNTTSMLSVLTSCIRPSIREHSSTSLSP